MKCKKIILVLFIISFIICNGSVTAFAMNTGFSTSEMSSEEQDTILSNIEFTAITQEPQKGKISCFDVSKTELIAMGSATSDKKYISVYDTAGKFQYGYAFNCDQSFGVQWDGADLIVYFVRGDIAALLDSNGTIKELRMIDDTFDNNTYWNHSVFSTEKSSGGNRYTIKNNTGLLNFFASSYSQLIKTDSDGNETILYDVSAEQTLKTVFILIAVFLFVALAIFVIIRQIFKAKKQ